MSESKNKKGFTLVEIMVVIAIIGILAAVVYASMDTARKKGRDTERKSNLKQLQAAVELYAQANGAYPSMGCVSGGWGRQNLCGSSGQEYIQGITDIMSLPFDYKTTSSSQGYFYRTGTINGRPAYKIMSYNIVESETVTANHEFARYPASAGCSGDMTSTVNTKTYAVYSSNAACELWD